VRIIAATHRDLEAAISAGRFREDLFYRLNVFPVQMPPLRERLEDLPILIEHLLQRQGQNGTRSIRLDKEAMKCLAGNAWPGNVRELANLLERLAILFPGQTISGADLPQRYRGTAPVTRNLNAGAHGDMAPFLAQPPAGIDAHLPLNELELHEDGECELDEDEEAAADAPQVYEILEGHLPRGGIDLKDHLSAIEIGLIRKALVEADGTVAEAARLLRIRRTTLVEKLRKYRLSA
jgi:sigma-54 specific flagellar transcriptional regulator A